MKTAQHTSTNWENFEAECPHCQFWNVFNRATDLQRFGPIDHMVVSCLAHDCRREFVINGDQCGPAYETLYYDAYETKARKRYGLTVLLLVQSLEMFFSHYFEEELVWRPFVRRRLEYDTSEVNAISTQLFEAVRPFAAVRLRNIFIRRVIASECVISLRRSSEIISSLRGDTERVESADIDHAPLSSELKSALLKLNETFLFALRNDVVHKTARRPTASEAERAFDETAAVLFPLQTILDMAYGVVPRL